MLVKTALLGTISSSKTVGMHTGFLWLKQSKVKHDMCDLLQNFLPVHPASGEGVAPGQPLSGKHSFDHVGVS